MPKVTIAIPTRNRLTYLRTALHSALNQTFKDLEIVVSDNRCTDGTTEFLASVDDPRVRVLRQTKDLAMVQNWNACVQAATGIFFLLLSDDDVLEPRAIELMVKTFTCPPDQAKVGMVYCLGRVIDADGKVLHSGMGAPAREEAPDLILAFFNSKRETWPCAIMLRREDLPNGYSPEFSLITDAAAWIQAVCRHGSARFVNEELVNYRVHASLTNATPPSVWQELNRKAAELAIQSLRKANRSSPLLERKIQQAVHQLNLRIVLCLPLAAKDKRRLTVLRKYFEYLPQFASWYGVVQMTRAVIVLLLPNAALAVLRAVRDKAMTKSSRQSMAIS